MTWNRAALPAAVPVAAVAVFAGIQSYTHIEDLGLSTGQSLADSRLLPLSVDLLILAGVVIILAGSWLGWLGVVPGVAATLFANVMSGVPHGPLAAAVAAWPAVAFTVASFMLERWLKTQVGQGGRGGRAVAGNPPGPGASRDAPQGAAPAGGQCGHRPGRTAEEAVVNAWLHGRDCLAGPPSQRRLAATYGLSRTKVAALVGPLNGQHPPGSGPPQGS
jgi:hypothetical protein